MLGSCVSKKQYNDLLSSEQRYFNEAENAKKALAERQVALKELSSENERLKAEINKLAQDTLDYSKKIFSLNQEINRLKNLNDELTDKLGKSKSEEEVKLLLADLQQLQDKLLAKEDELNKTDNQLSQLQITLNEKERELAAKQKALEEQQQMLAGLQRTLNEQQSALAAQEAALNEKNQKLAELTEMLNARDQMMKDLKDRVSRALVGFEGNGLTVTERNGRIYVSLDEKLLFQSGRWDVDQRGVSAIEKLSTVLAENPDINVVIEGHTDNVPYNGTGQILDNWDLSTKRATAIVRILFKNKNIDPVRITAAGRSEYLPIDTDKTAEARQKNRRTEIILSPNLDEIMEMLSK